MAASEKTDNEQKLREVKEKLRWLCSPTEGWYKHYKGREIIVETLSIREEDYAILVHYRELGEEWWWTRELDNFNSMAVGEKGLVKRFQRVEDTVHETSP